MWVYTNERTCKAYASRAFEEDCKDIARKIEAVDGDTIVCYFGDRYSKFSFNHNRMTELKTSHLKRGKVR